jgi:integrase
MPVHVTRRRKKGGPWYARGTVKVGKARIIVSEYSTGCISRADADAQAAARDAEVRESILGGSAGCARRLTISDCIVAYDEYRPGGVPSYDAGRLADFNERIGHRSLADVEAAWNDWFEARGRHLAPATVKRCRAILSAALMCGARHHQVVAPKVPAVHAIAGEHARVAFLTEREADRLVEAYNPFAQPVAIMLRYQGLRTQEALRVDWRAVNWARRTLFISGGTAIGSIQTKSRRPRMVPMHRRVRIALFLLWRRQGRPSIGPVFLSSRGRPYADTRGEGGNPLAKAHATACRKAGLAGFRVHDWRHHWASHLVMAGVDLPTIMRLGGWSDHRMVLRYAAVGTEHMAAAIQRVA